MKGKIVILSAPSGTGKSSIIKYLMANRPDLDLAFSISATSRKPREGEEHGREYYFLSEEDFRKRIDGDEFVEWEEVYAGNLYGTLESEVERITGEGKTLIMDIDVKGGLNVKKRYGDRALSIFIEPPSREELRKRLEGRATDSRDDIERRLAKADYELEFAPQFDCTVVNDTLEDAARRVGDRIMDFKTTTDN